MAYSNRNTKLLKLILLFENKKIIQTNSFWVYFFLNIPALTKWLMPIQKCNIKVAHNDMKVKRFFQISTNSFRLSGNKHI